MPVISRPLSGNSTSLPQLIYLLFCENETVKKLKLSSSVSQSILSLSKRATTVEEGGPDTKGIKYVVAAVVVPFGLIFLAVFICVMRCRSKGRKARMAIEEAEKNESTFSHIKSDFTSSMKISHTFKKGDKVDENGGTGTNIEIRLVPKESDSDIDYLNRKNQILERILKSDSNSLFEELRSNNYFNNYMDINKRRGARISVLNNEINDMHIYKPGGNSIKKRKSLEMVIVDAEVDPESISKSNSNSIGSRNMKKKSPDYEKSTETKSQRSSAFSSNEEFYSADDGGDEILKIIPPPVSENVTGVNTKNTALHRKLIDSQKQFIHEIPEDYQGEESRDSSKNSEEQDVLGEVMPSFPRGANAKKEAPGSTSIYSNDTVLSAETNQNSMATNMTKSTAATSITANPTTTNPGFVSRLLHTDTLKRKSLPKTEELIDSDNSVAGFEFVRPPSKIEYHQNREVDDISIPKRDSFEEKLSRRSQSLKESASETESAISEDRLINPDSKRDSFLDRNTYVKATSPVPNETISPISNQDVPQFYDNVLEESDSEESDYENQQRNDLVRLSVNMDTGSNSGSDSGYSSRNKRYGVGSQLEDLEEVEEPITSPRPVTQRRGIQSVIMAKNKNFLKQGKRDSTVSDKENTINSSLADTIDDINTFLKENGVYTSPVIIDNNVVLGGLVITNNSETGITNINGKNFSTDSLNKHLSNDSSVNILLANASPENANVRSGSSSVYDNRRSMQSMKPISPVLGLNSPRLGMKSPKMTPNINGVLEAYSPKQKETFEIINSPQIPKRSEKRNNSDTESLRYQNESRPGVWGVNAPVVGGYLGELSAKTSSSSTRSSKTRSQVRSSKALGIDFDKIKDKISSPSLKLSDEAMLTNRTPDQIVRDKFYDSEESYNHTFDEDEDHQRKYNHNKTNSLSSPYSNMV